MTVTRCEDSDAGLRALRTKGAGVINTRGWIGKNMVVIIQE